MRDVESPGRHLTELCDHLLDVGDGFPLDVAVIIDAEALQMAQLSPSKATLSTLSSLTFSVTQM